MDKKRKGLIAALALGLVSGPAVALGITGLIGSGTADAAPAEAPAAIVITTDAPTTTTAVAATSPGADLLAACTLDGPALVDSETAGTITDVEQAALDALRDICATSGMALEDPVADQVSAPPVVVKTVTVSASAPATTYGGDDDGYEGHEEHEEGEDD